MTASNIVAESLNSVKGLGAECTEGFPELIIIFSYEFRLLSSSRLGTNWKLDRVGELLFGLSDLLSYLL